ncbi:MAG: hypothetical protein COT84_00275 [Chlamydiae bacterium CG10_big_fil_rev_8_21_14_0_10_35_9]|nr:MAG: hypothetical protein COT84_00275 [Chlamydiae bacterium CG10_big_fil_rev_8_21_14_0_10_35_9]
MGKKDLINQVARLETINDQLSSELKYLDQISRKLGFAEGLKTLKEAALELLEIEKRKGAIEEDDEDLQD